MGVQMIMSKATATRKEILQVHGNYKNYNSESQNQSENYTTTQFRFQTPLLSGQSRELILSLSQKLDLNPQQQFYSIGKDSMLPIKNSLDMSKKLDFSLRQELLDSDGDLNPPRRTHI